MSRPVVLISSDATITSSFSGCDVVASGGQRTITLAAAAGASDGSDIRVINVDGGNGKILSGFPADVRTVLYPNQAVEVTTASSAWIATQKPGRFPITDACRAIYVSNASSAVAGNNSNDGLTPSTPLATIAVAVQAVQKDLDTQQRCPIIALVAGSSFKDDPLNLGGQPTGGNLIQLSVYGNGQAAIVTDYVPPISIGDNAELNIDVNAFSSGASLLLWGCRGNGNNAGAGIYQHNNGLFDMEGAVTIIGNSPNHSAIFFDGPCPGASIANGFNVGGYFGDVFRMDEGGGRFTVSGPVNGVQWPNGAGTPVYPTAARIWGIYDHNELLTNASYGGSWASLGPSLAAGHGRIVKFGTTIAGGVGSSLYGLVTDFK
jgi:hypothetical protein